MVPAEPTCCNVWISTKVSLWITKVFSWAVSPVNIAQKLPTHLQSKLATLQTRDSCGKAQVTRWHWPRVSLRGIYCHSWGKRWKLSLLQREHLWEGNTFCLQKKVTSHAKEGVWLAPAVRPGTAHYHETTQSHWESPCVHEVTVFLLCMAGLTLSNTPKVLQITRLIWISSCRVFGTSRYLCKQSLPHTKVRRNATCEPTPYWPRYARTSSWEPLAPPEEISQRLWVSDHNETFCHS